MEHPTCGICNKRLCRGDRFAYLFTCDECMLMQAFGKGNK